MKPLRNIFILAVIVGISGTASSVLAQSNESQDPPRLTMAEARHEAPYAAREYARMHHMKRWAVTTCFSPPYNSDVGPDPYRIDCSVTAYRISKKHPKTRSFYCRAYIPIKRASGTDRGKDERLTHITYGVMFDVDNPASSRCSRDLRTAPWVRAQIPPDWPYPPVD